MLAMSFQKRIQTLAHQHAGAVGGHVHLELASFPRGRTTSRPSSRNGFGPSFIFSIGSVAYQKIAQDLLSRV